MEDLTLPHSSDCKHTCTRPAYMPEFNCMESRTGDHGLPLLSCRSAARVLTATGAAVQKLSLLAESISSTDGSSDSTADNDHKVLLWRAKVRRDRKWYGWTRE